MNALIENTIRTAVDKHTDSWDGSPFQDIVKLTNDERGRWGEDLIHQLLTQAGVKNTWLNDSNINQSDAVLLNENSIHFYQIADKPL